MQELIASYSQTYLLFFLLFLLPLLSAFKRYDNKKLFERISHFSTFASIIAIIYFLLNMVTPFLGAVFIWVLCTIIVLSNIVEFTCKVYFNETFNSHTLSIIMESNTREGKEFFTTFIDKKILFVFIGVLLPFIIIQSQAAVTVVTYTWLIFTLFTIVTIKSWKTHLQSNILVKFITTLYFYYNQKKKQTSYRKKIISTNESITQTQESPENIVIVIGESLHKNRMSLYGYNRKTTPMLDAMYEKDMLFAFNDVICSDASTRLMIPKIFTFFDSQSKNDWTHYENIVNIYKHLGYKTHWISNQEKYGLDGEAIATSFANLCDYSYFNKEENISNQFDEDLLQIFETLLHQKDKKKLFIIHLMGNHFEYKKRYPMQYEKFNGTLELSNGYKVPQKLQATYNAYDNSVLYNDYIVANIIEKIDAKNQSSICFYFPDHGEEVCDFREYVGHNLRLSSAPMAEIPFIVYASEIYKQKNENIVKQMQSTLKNPYSTDYFIHFLLYTTRVELQSYNKDFSLLASNTLLNSRNFTGLDYDKEIKHRTQIKLHEKIWMHRANSLYLLEKAKKTYHGVEIDIYVQNDTLYVTHDRKISKVTLETYLRHFDPKMHLWLDFKNLDQNNTDKAKETLLQLVRKNGLDRKKIIVESPNAKALKQFNGYFFTAFYLPYLKDSAFNDESIKNELIKNIREAQSNAISFAGYMYNYVKTTFFPLFQDKKMLTWFEHKKIFSLRDDYDFIAQLVKNEKLKAVLVGSQERTDTVNKIKLSHHLNVLVHDIETLNATKQKVLIYGAGNTAKLVIWALHNVVGIIDKDEKKVGLKIKNISVDTIDALDDTEFDTILITVLGREEDIIDYLVTQKGIDSAKITTFNIKK